MVISVRKYYMDNIRWMTVLLVVLYHVIYMYNGIVTHGVAGPFREKQYQDGLLYLIMSLSGTGVLWFIQLLWLFSMLLVLIRKLEKEKLYARTEKSAIGIPYSRISFLRIGHRKPAVIRWKKEKQ